MDWVCSGCGRHYSWILNESPYCQPITTGTTGGTQPEANNNLSDEIAFLEGLRDNFYQIKCVDYKSIGFKMVEDRIAQLQERSRNVVKH
jgi:hypothetical protein